MRFNLKKPSKKILIGAAALSIMLHMFVCKLPVDAFKSESTQTVQQLPKNVVPIQIISIAAPRLIAEAKPVEDKKNPQKTEIATKVKSETAKFNFSEKELDEKKQPKSLTEKEKSNNTQQFANQLTSNDNGSNASSVIPLVKQAKYTQTIAPIYPSRAVDLEQQGTVIIHALVDENGKIQEIIIKNSSGFKLLDNSAKNAVSKWQFQASEISGKIAKSWVEVPVNFKLN
jgi:TonB family protein